AVTLIFEDKGRRPNPELGIMRVNHATSGSFAGWLVDFSIPKAKSALVLARSRPIQSNFAKCELFGALEDIREECLLDETVVAQSLPCFFNSGTPDPSLVWLDYFDCVRPTED